MENLPSVQKIQIPWLNKTIGQVKTKQNKTHTKQNKNYNLLFCHRIFCEKYKEEVKDIMLHPMVSYPALLTDRSPNPQTTKTRWPIMSPGQSQVFHQNIYSMNSSLLRNRQQKMGDVSATLTKNLQACLFLRCHIIK